MAKPGQSKAQFAADTTAPPNFASASLFRRHEQRNDPVCTGIMIGLGIALLVFIGSMIAVLMMHAPSF